jgi:hypothetical protein
MRKYLADHPRHSGAYLPEEVAALAAICDQVTAELNITERVDIDLVAARILALYEGGVRDPEEIVKVVVASALADRRRAI